MQEKFRLYEMGRGQSDNIKVAGDYNLTLVVHSIEERAVDGLIPHVLFVAAPSIEDYSDSRNRQTIAVEATDETRMIKLMPNQSVKIEANGRDYTVKIVSIGHTAGRQWSYADFTVDWD